MHKLIDEAEDVFAKAALARDCALAKVQLGCSHPEVLEAPYQEGWDVRHTTPPFRVCSACGFAEEGWSCGYSVLEGNLARRIVDATHETAYATRRGRTHANHQFVGFGRRGFFASYEAAVKQSFPKAFGE